MAEARYAQQIQEVPAFGSHVLSPLVAYRLVSQPSVERTNGWPFAATICGGFVWFGMNAGPLGHMKLS